MNSRFKLVVVTSSTILVVLLLLGASLGRSASPENAYHHLAVYSEVLSRIKSEYVEEPDIKSVTLGALNGLLESIDPYASYLNAEQYKQYLKAQDVRKATVGLVLSKKYGYVGVVDAIAGSPAAKAGLNTGDMLESINGVATRDMPLAYAELLMNGEPGSTIEMSVLRLRKPEPQKITLNRAYLKYPPIVSKLLPDQVGLIQLQSIEPGKLKELAASLDQLQKQGAKRFVLDLRNAAIGKADDGVALASLFMDKGLVTYLQGQKVARQDFLAEPSRNVFKQPLVVVTNRGTANAAEIAAAALLESKRAEVVGERTYGDAAVRKAVTMEDGSAVILSVAKYYSPSGKAIQDVGVTPTYLVTDADPAAEAEDESLPPPDAPKKAEEDVLLKRAIDVLVHPNSQAADKAKPTAEVPLPQAPGATVKNPLIKQ